MNDDPGKALIAAWLLDGAGSGRELDWKEVQTWKPEDGVLWVRLNRESQDALAWLRGRKGLPLLFAEALTSEETRPRMRFQEGLLMLILRAVNLNPGADPDDMVQLRMFTDGKIIISLRRRKVYAVQDLQKQLALSKAPRMYRH